MVLLTKKMGPNSGGIELSSLNELILVSRELASLFYNWLGRSGSILEGKNSKSTNT